jgi:hypothetical protein
LACQVSSVIEISPVTLSNKIRVARINAPPQVLHLFLEQINYLLPRRHPPRDFDAICGARRDVDQILEFGIGQGKASMGLSSI